MSPVYQNLVLLILFSFSLIRPLNAQSMNVVLTGEADSSDLAEISQIRNEIQQVEMNMDVEGLHKLKKYFTDDVAMLPGSRREQGPEKIIEFHEKFFSRFDDLNVQFTIESIHVIGGLAVEKGYTSGTVDPKGKPERPSSGKYLYVYEKNESGQWRIVRMSW